LKQQRESQRRAEQQRLQQQRQRRSEQERMNRQRTRTGTAQRKSYGSHRQVVNGLNREFSARSRGQQRVSNSASFQPHTSSRAFRGGGAGMRGGGFRGGGRRR
jgi:hypothetical protein